MYNSLPRQTLDDILSKFFEHINEICKDFLTSHILAVTQNKASHELSQFASWLKLFKLS
jgi:hypothetical protein